MKKKSKKKTADHKIMKSKDNINKVCMLVNGKMSHVMLKKGKQTNRSQESLNFGLVPSLPMKKDSTCM